MDADGARIERERVGREETDAEDGVGMGGPRRRWREGVPQGEDAAMGWRRGMQVGVRKNGKV